MNIKRLLQETLPPIMYRRLTSKAQLAEMRQKLGRFYCQFLKHGDLCFDVGANIGNRTRCFRDLGCKVIAIEPQLNCFLTLRREFEDDGEVVLINKGVGGEAGIKEMKVSTAHVLSSMSDEFIQRTSASGRFEGVTWREKMSVEMTTLDELIKLNGVPRFIKIDVEGYEFEVIKGLNSAVPALSIEWAPEMNDSITETLKLISRLGDYEFNMSWAESLRFHRTEWRSISSMIEVINEFAGETYHFGDIYARLRGLELS